LKIFEGKNTKIKKKKKKSRKKTPKSQQQKNHKKNTKITKKKQNHKRKTKSQKNTKIGQGQICLSLDKKIYVINRNTDYWVDYTLGN